MNDRPFARDEIMEEIARENAAADNGIIRKFETGATRDTDTEKHDPEGFLSPIVIERFNEYMHKNRKQKDGQLRDSDNWQKGIPIPVYRKSLWRHFQDQWLYFRGFGDQARESLEDALCGILFNTMGILFEVLKSKKKDPSPNAGLCGMSFPAGKIHPANPKIVLEPKSSFFRNEVIRNAVGSIEIEVGQLTKSGRETLARIIGEAFEKLDEEKN